MEVLHVYSKVFTPKCSQGPRDGPVTCQFSVEAAEVVVLAAQAVVVVDEVREARRVLVEHGRHRLRSQECARLFSMEAIARQAARASSNHRGGSPTRQRESAAPRRPRTLELPESTPTHAQPLFLSPFPPPAGPRTGAACPRGGWPRRAAPEVKEKRL